MEEIIERLKIEKQKIMKVLENNSEECFAENSQIKTAEDYQIMVGLLVNVGSSITQLEQMAEMQRRNAEQIAKMQEEAQEAQ